MSERCYLRVYDPKHPKRCWDVLCASGEEARARWVNYIRAGLCVEGLFGEEDEMPKTKEPGSKAQVLAERAASGPEAPPRGMGDRIYEVLERPQSPSEAALHHEIEALKKKVGRLEGQVNLPGDLDRLEVLKRRLDTQDEWLSARHSSYRRKKEEARL